MKTCFFVLILAVSICAYGQEKYFPGGYQNIYIGMPADSLLALKENKSGSSFQLHGTRQYVETPSRDTVIKQVMYLLDANRNVYEVIFEYQDFFNLELYMKDLYGPWNTDDEEWLFSLPNGRELHIWNHLNRLCIADGTIYK